MVTPCIQGCSSFIISCPILYSLTLILRCYLLTQILSSSCQKKKHFRYNIYNNYGTVQHCGRIIHQSKCSFSHAAFAKYFSYDNCKALKGYVQISEIPEGEAG